MESLFRELVDDLRKGFITRRGFIHKAGALGLSSAAAALLSREAAAQEAPIQAQGAASPSGTPAEVIWKAIADGNWEVVDLSLTTAHNHPTNWPTDPLFVQRPLAAMGAPIVNATGYVIAPGSIVNVNMYELTAHTGTQVDFPPHFVPPPGVEIPNAPSSEWALKTGDQYEMKSMMGPAVVLDARAVLAANTENGMSAHITRAWIEAWEERYGKIQPGDVPALFSGYSDMYYKPFPNGDRMQDRMLWQPLVTKTAPGWCAFEPDAVNLLADRGVVHIAVDAPSFGYTENGQPPHVAGLLRGMSWTEGATNLGSLPLRGAIYVCAPYKVEKQEAGIVRAFAIKPADMPTVGSTPPLVLNVE